MRQTRLFQYANGEKPARITRGNSDLPKEEEKQQSVEEEISEEEEEEKSGDVPKTKKIHHMTLKAMERKQKAEELLALLSPEERAKLQKPVVEKIPKKRGRPKLIHKKQVEKDSYEIQQQLEDIIPTLSKKQLNLRKRQSNMKFLEESEELKQNIQEIQEKEIIVKEVQQIKPPVVADNSQIPPAPKKRGRKKKVITQTPVQQLNTPKIFTIPKGQTYDNYNLYYNKIMQQSKQVKGIDMSLIFDKFSNIQTYQQLIKAIQSQKK